MKTISLDFKSLETMEQIHDHLERQFGFPNYYGRNLDALYDLLTEITEDTCIRIWLPQKKEEKQDRDCCMDKITGVMQDAEEENSHLRVIIDRVEENDE
ncbi:MAG: barstar family protein [Brotaphodocola sp.]